ncbi:MAG TPA: UDP-N-acetylmuramate dehydrogenase [Polyangiaceae bacterium]
MSLPLRDVALGPRTTLGVGGSAQYFWEVTSEQELTLAVRWAKARGLPLRVLGGGSNVVVADAGFAGLVIHVALRGVETSGSDPVEVRVGAGEPWHPFVLSRVAEKQQGIECLAGIPGSVGATPIQNVGAYGQDVSETIARVEAYDIEHECFRTFDTRALRFGYRDSFFKSQAPDAFIVTRVHFQLVPGAPPALRYAELEREAQRIREAAEVDALGVTEVCQVVLGLRRKKSMSVDACDENHRSCGSFFTNPRVPTAQVERVAREVPAEPVPQHPEPGGLVKLPAAWLIERAGLAKGVRRGSVGLSTRHSLAIVCHDGATANDVLRFAHEVRATVLDKFGVTLEPEPVFWGFPAGSGGLPPLPT